jgi:hypothetical protein
MDELRQANASMQEMLKLLVVRTGTPPDAQAAATKIEIVAPKKALKTQDKIEIALRREVLDTRNLVRAVGEPAHAVEDAVKALVKQGKIYNLRPPEFSPQALTWRLGNGATQAEYIHAVHQVLIWSWYSNGELMQVLDVTNSKAIENAITELRRHSVENGGQIRIVSRKIDGHSLQYHVEGVGSPTPLTPRFRPKTKNPIPK